MKNLLVRVATALILLPLVIAAFFVGGLFLKTLLLIVSLIVGLEIANMVSPKSASGRLSAILALCGFLIPSLFFSNYLGIILVFGLSMLGFNLFVLFRQVINQAAYEKLCVIFYFSLYSYFGVAVINWLANDNKLIATREGLSFVLLTCIVTWANDSFAYFSGRAFGSHPLFFSVSQKKTWEGFLGGAFGSIGLVIALSWLPKILFDYNLFFALTPIDIAVVAGSSIVLAPLGDLLESRIKRLYEVKDASNILPGHGGLLDRIDALLAVLPWTAVYAFVIRPLLH